MSNDKFVDENEQTLILVEPEPIRVIEIAYAFPVRLQTLDLARHAVIAPDKKRYVVATFDDSRIGGGYVTAIYPQQNGYLTLLRLCVYETSSETPAQAVERHVALVQTIQRGQLDTLLVP